METPLTPLDFLRRARKLHGAREAVVDGDLRLTYEQFGRALRPLVSGPGETGRRAGRPRGHTRAEHPSAPRAVLRRAAAGRRDRAAELPAGRRRLRLPREPQRDARSCACTRITWTRSTACATRCRRSNTSSRWKAASRAGSTTKRLLADGNGEFARPSIAEGDLLAINYTSGTTSRPKGVMITHRNAWVNAIGTLTHLPMTPADRYLWTLPMFHANGWTLHVDRDRRGGTHVCLRQVDAATDLSARQRGTHYHALRRADGADRHRQRPGARTHGRCDAVCA